MTRGRALYSLLQVCEFGPGRSVSVERIITVNESTIRVRVPVQTVVILSSTPPKKPIGVAAESSRAEQKLGVGLPVSERTG